LTESAGERAGKPDGKTLRFAVLGLASAETLYWLYIVIVASKRANNPAADAMQTIPAILATPPFLLLTLPCPGPNPRRSLADPRGSACGGSAPSSCLSMLGRFCSPGSTSVVIPAKAGIQ
jgi:hypothetical protein